ncbi:HNHc domain-containing protein [Trichophyton interdigitale]|uniref:HNHc domain-containing protein n=1 Tax=Trichophyton interdigitale TaxID=101480 RepID=A0A9P5CYK5_9EURO|nr:HNHc domain-containing protein [Trichophyton interdigitale]KAF3894771.1 HNHc domain-containing protein [Trichophyton interdigitale]KAG8209607.1 HNHc domain-containing protein [Trichophyton interdigitale]
MSRPGPNTEFESDRKAELLRRLKNLLDIPVPSPAWAGLWLADLSVLETTVDKASSDASYLQTLRSSILLNDGLLVRQWCQRDQSSSLQRSTVIGQAVQRREDVGESPSDLPAAPEPHTLPRPTKRQRTRSFSARDNCCVRDGDRCIITKHAYPDVAHIYPYSMGGVAHESPNSTFWTLLRSYWSNERVENWRAAVFPRGTETLCNLLCLSPNMHRWHSKGLLGLQPVEISEDKSRLTLRFYWLPQHQFSRNVDLSARPDIPCDLNGLEMDFKAWNAITERKIRSGDEIILTTSDPQNLPLPDWDLLELQWTLQRLAALSGVVDVDPEEYSDYDSDGA